MLNSDLSQMSWKVAIDPSNWNLLLDTTFNTLVWSWLSSKALNRNRMFEIHQRRHDTTDISATKRVDITQIRTYKNLGSLKVNRLWTAKLQRRRIKYRRKNVQLQLRLFCRSYESEMRLRLISLCVSEFHGFLGLNWKGKKAVKLFLPKKMCEDEEEMLDFKRAKFKSTITATTRPWKHWISRNRSTLCFLLVSLLGCCRFFFYRVEAHPKASQNDMESGNNTLDWYRFAFEAKKENSYSFF